MRVVFTRHSRAQLRSIQEFIALHASEEVARRFVLAIVEHCRSLDRFPDRGARRDGLRPGLRVLTFRKRATIAYAVEEDRVRIVGIFYAGQDLAGAFDD